MQRAKNFVPSALFALLFLMLALAPFLVTGCSREEEEPAIEQAAPVTEPEPAAKAYVLGDVVPVTRDMLALMPESATAAVALPPMNGLLNKGVALAKRILPPEMDVDEWVKLLIADAAADAGVPDAKSIEEVAMAKGLDISSPIAVFADFASAAASAKVAIGAMGETVAASPEATSADAVNQGVAGPTGAQVEAAMEEVTIPDLVGVVGCINTELAVASLREILESEGSSIDLSKMEEIDAKGVMISFTEEGPFGYFTTDDLLVVGNSLALLQETAVRVDAPVPVRYGSTECPASEPDEIVALARADKLLPMLQDLLPALIAMNPQMASIAKMQMATLNKYAEAFTGDDPLVMTIAWTDDIIEMRSRTDLSKHPGLTEVIGEIKPLKLAPMLPEGTLLMIAQQFNEETKEQIEQSWMASLPPEMQSSPEFAGISEIVEKVIKLVDDELVIGLADSGAGIPHLVAMASLTDAQQTKELLQSFSPMIESETHNDIPIQTLGAVPMFPIYVSFPGSVLLLSNDVGKVKQGMDMLQSGATSPYFGSLTPPLDVSTPRQNAVSVSTKLLSDVVVPLASMFGQMPPEAANYIDTICSVLREIRLLNELQGDWLVGSVSLYLQPST